MARINTKLGDIFSVNIDDEYKVYFQFVAVDETQLGSSVIRVFEEKYYNTQPEPDLNEVVKGKVQFYAHCILNTGLKLGFWIKEGNNKEIGITDQFTFFWTNDFGKDRGGLPIEVSENWFVWKINDEKFTRVGKLDEKYWETEIGLVLNPVSIINRIKTGAYGKGYPKFKE